MSEATSTSLERTDTEYKQSVLSGIKELPMSKRLGIIAALALAVALGVATLLWMQRPDYGPLYNGLGEKEMGDVVESLEKLNVEHRIDPLTGAVLVPKDRIHELRIKLAAQGLPKSGGVGYELLDQETGFGSSQALEATRFQRALEGELARSLMTLQNVRNARVHLALPKQSVFVRDRKSPSASVLVDLHPGRALDKSQVEAIVHLVASSVPQMEPGQVTVVDQSGHLLNSKSETDALGLTAKQFEYKTLVEERLTDRIQNILSPLVGVKGVRAQINADIDFSKTERTEEKFAPEKPAIRSEQNSEEINRLNGVAGIPGALSNQPPAAGVAPEVAKGPSGADPKQEPVSSNKSSTRNFELDRTVSHTSPADSQMRRLTVAVVVDNQRSMKDGKEISTPYSDAELERFNNLVKQAVGFDSSRGDQVTVTNAAFLPQDSLEPLPEVPLWERAWFLNLMKLAVALIVVLALVFGVFRPAVRGLQVRQLEALPPPALVSPGEEGQEGEDTLALESAEGELAGGELAEDKLTLSSDEPLLLPGGHSYEKRLEFVRKMVDEDPKRVAQVIKGWVTS